ncbi:MAG: DUF2892 domain-containing protein [Endomicrobiales bacterium]|nr:DUF2892 domain-containing protein [Endomicrobiales bacterium]
MKKNVGTADRVVRVVLALVIAALVFGKFVSGILALVLGALALILVFTAVVGWCGIYSLLGVNTCPVKPSEESKHT